MSRIFDFYIGILLGAGAILPGVSSGVICVILGMYDKLIDAIFNLFKNFKKNFLYLLPIGLGGIVGVFLFGNILKTLFSTFPTQTSFCFIGLILGSIPLLVKKVNSEHTFRLRYIVFTVISFILGCFLVFLEGKLNSSNNVSNFSFLFLVLSGFLMAIGVVFPGVSNTLILMCLRSLPYIFKWCGKYKFKHFNTYGNWPCIRLSIFFDNYKVVIKALLYANLLFYNRFYTW